MDLFDVLKATAETLKNTADTIADNIKDASQNKEPGQIIKNTATTIVEKIAKPFEVPSMSMRLCMLGARGVGKTSVITSLFYGQQNALSGTKLFLTADPEMTETALNAKKTELLQIFDGLHKEGSLVTESGIDATFTESRFLFRYGMSSANVNIGLEICDYPGEYLTSNPEAVAEYIHQADAVMIAIDTPCLMEAGGRYHEAKNKPRLVTEYLKKHLADEDDKLILLVPLKCEKYFREGRIEEVTERVKESYAELIAFLKERGKKTTCCAVTPIQTLGGIVFDSFGADESGETEYLLSDGSVLPARVNYHYTASDSAYAPQYCEQPLYYLLAFVSKQYAKARKEAKAENGSLLDKLREMLRLIPHVDEFIAEIGVLGSRRKTSGDGYQILFGRGRI